MIMVAGCGTDSGDKSSAEEAKKACANMQPEAAQFEMSKPGRIAFSKDGNIYTMNPDGSDEVDLTKGEFGSESNELNPAWSPDGKRIAFASDREGRDDSIYVMNADGTGLRKLTGGIANTESPRWSPDGKKIAYTAADEEEHYALSAMNSDGSNVTTIRKGPSPGFIGMADWSPDGSRIVFMVDESYTGGEIDTYVMNADGRCVEQLTDVSGDDSGARWSPDGERILFGSNRNGGGIYLMNPDGTDQMRILKTPPGESGLDTFRPAWSPDGKKIAWTGKYEGDVGTRIYVMNPDGTGLTVIHDELETASSLDWQPVSR